MITRIFVRFKIYREHLTQNKKVIMHGPKNFIIICSITNLLKLYYVGQREFNIILAQLHMNCSNLNAHLCSLHVIDNPACGCSHRVEDTAHFFLDCPLYYAQRLSLRNTVTRSSQFRLETLLYGDDDLDYESNVAIILAVHEFIKDSERF